jgi:hypothetical protein
MRAATMEKLITTVAHGNAGPSTALEYGFLLSEAASLPEYLERLREALFLTGAAPQSAKVINAASSGLLPGADEPPSSIDAAHRSN